MRGIVLAGGSGTRLWPLTWVVSKQLLPVYDKPLIYYSLSTLLLAGIREVLVITTSQGHSSFVELLGNGHELGIQIQYEIQEEPDGIASALRIGEGFIGTEKVCLVLGDNIFYGVGLGLGLMQCTNPQGAIAFSFKVPDPERYGVIVLDSNGKPIQIVEKPKTHISDLAIPGLYFFDNTAVERVMSVQKSTRGEYEITSLLDSYLQDGQLSIQALQRGTAWLDCGTAESMQDAANFVRIIEERQGLKIGCIEEIVWRQGWITDSELMILGKRNMHSSYGKYIMRLVANA